MGKLQNRLLGVVLATSLTGCNSTPYGKSLIRNLGHTMVQQYIASSVQNEVSENYRENRENKYIKERSAEIERARNRLELVKVKANITLYKWEDSNNDGIFNGNESLERIYDSVDNSVANIFVTVSKRDLFDGFTYTLYGDGKLKELSAEINKSGLIKKNSLDSGKYSIHARPRDFWHMKIQDFIVKNR